MLLSSVIFLLILKPKAPAMIIFTKLRRTDISQNEKMTCKLKLPVSSKENKWFYGWKNKILEELASALHSQRYLGQSVVI